MGFHLVKWMKKTAVFYLTILFAAIGIVPIVEAGVCKKCDRIREYNRAHPSKYVYYDDYLKDLEEAKAECEQEKGYTEDFDLEKSPQEK
jgi:hypothetical protein